MSILWTAAELRAATSGAMPVPFDASGISIDSRTIRPGELFVALVGDNGDGHDHVADALARGAAGALVHRRPDGATPLLLVEDTLVGLRALAARARARFTGRLVAVTGSVGKTTTKEMLRAILATQGAVHAAEASHNNHWGVPLTLARLPEDAAACVVEIGMNHPGEIAPLARLARPHVAVITAIERAHVGHMGRIEAIAAEKATIMAGLEPGGIAVLPAATPHLPVLRAAAGSARSITFGEDGEAWLLAMQQDAEGSDLAVGIGGEILRFRLGAPGAHMALDALAALTAAHALGFDVRRGAAALAAFGAVAGRGARRHIPVADGSALLLDESYNASSAAIRAALAVLALQPARRRIAVLGDMLELGDEGPAEHAGLADAAAAADLVFTCGPLMHHLWQALPASRRGAHAPDAAALAPLVAAAIADGDAVLVKGSLGSRMRLVVAALDRPVAEAR